MVRKIFNAVMSSYFWVGALNHASNGNYNKAWTVLSKCEKYHIKDFEFYLLKSFLCSALNDNLECIRFSSKAFQMIEESDAVNLDEREYLKTFAVYLIELAVSKTPEINEVPDKMANSISGYNVQNVRSVFLDNYPITKRVT